MEIVPNDIDPVEFREEVNFRSSRAGLTTRSGDPIPLKIKSRPFTEQGRINYVRIFGHD